MASVCSARLKQDSKANGSVPEGLSKPCRISLPVPNRRHIDPVQLACSTSPTFPVSVVHFPDTDGRTSSTASKIVRCKDICSFAMNPSSLGELVTALRQSSHDDPYADNKSAKYRQIRRPAPHPSSSCHRCSQKSAICLANPSSNGCDESCNVPQLEVLAALDC